MCDTLCLQRPHETLFAKNSDREPGEAQSLEVHPARTHSAATVRCTTLELPQSSHTHAVIISRPAWMWGCEMGANDAGVVGGNEAVFTRLPVAHDGLTGMDLLRLALERDRARGRPGHHRAARPVPPGRAHGLSPPGLPLPLELPAGRRT
jgi:dipeptidase